MKNGMICEDSERLLSKQNIFSIINIFQPKDLVGDLVSNLLDLLTHVNFEEIDQSKSQLDQNEKFFYLKLVSFNNKIKIDLCIDLKIKILDMCVNGFTFYEMDEITSDNNTSILEKIKSFLCNDLIKEVAVYAKKNKVKRIRTTHTIHIGK